MTTPDGQGQDLFASITREGDAMRVKLVGPNLGQREGPIVETMITTALGKAKAKYVVLDFDEIEFMNSSGLGSCVKIHSVSKVDGATLVVTGLRPDILEVLKLTRMDKLFKIAADEKKLEKILRK